MKYKYFILLLFLPFISFCQDSTAIGMIDRLCGLKIQQTAYFNLGKYTIFADKTYGQFTPKSIKKLKRKYKLKKADNETSTTALTQRNKVVTKKTPLKNGNTEISTMYFVEKGDLKIDIIGFYSINIRDSVEEEKFVKLYTEKKIPQSCFMDHPVSSVDFAGRTIELNNSCQWMNVNSIQCSYFGQMNWSLHKSLKGAKMQTQVQYEATKGKGKVKLLEEEEVPIIFEGKESTAIRTRYKIKVPKIVMGGSNELIIYYVSEEIRGRYISCVLSHYSNDSLTENGVPALLAKVMKLKS